MSKWDEIAASQEFRDADRETREATRQMFWREVIRPQTDEANRARTKRMFLDATSSHVAREQLSDDVEPSQGVGGGRGGQGGPTAEQMGANAPKPVGLFSSLKEAFAPGPSMSSETAAAMLDQPRPDDMPIPTSDLVRQEMAPGPAQVRDNLERVRARIGSAPTLKAAPETSSLGKALRRFDAKPLDNSLGGLAMETGADAVRGAVSGVNSLSTAMWGGVRAAADVAGADNVAGVAAAAAKAGNDQARALDGRDPESITKLVFQSTFANVPVLLGLGAGTKALAAMGGISGAQAYDEARNAGKTADEALERGVVHGVAEVLGERVGLPALAGLFAKAAAKVSTKELGHALAGLLVKEQVGEQATTAIQDAYDKAGRGGLRPDMTLGDYLNDVIQTSKVTLGQSLLMGGAAGVARHFQADPAKMRQAFVNVADAHGMSPKAAAAIQAQAAQMPPEQATAFVERAIAAVEKRGLVKRIGAALSWRKAVETPGTQPEIINNPAAPTAAEMGWGEDQPQGATDVGVSTVPGAVAGGRGDGGMPDDGRSVAGDGRAPAVDGGTGAAARGAVAAGAADTPVRDGSGRADAALKAPTEFGVFDRIEPGDVPQASQQVELAGEDWASSDAGLITLDRSAAEAGVDTGTLHEDVARGLGDAATDAEYSRAVATALTQAIKAKTGRAPTMPTNMATRGVGAMGTKVDAKAEPGFSAADVARKPDVSKKAPETNTSPERVQESPKTEQVAPASQAEVAPAPPPAGPVAAERPAEPVIEHVTGKGKTLTGYVRNVPAAEAVKMDPGTFKKGTGMFVRKVRADAWDAANGKAQSAAPAQAQPVGATGEGAAVSRPTPEPVVSAATAPSPRQPNGSDTKKAEASFKKPTIEKKPAPRKSALAAEGQKAAQKRADYFTPGSIIKSYSGHDEVLEYAPGENGEWKVKVHSVVKKDGEWVREGKPQDARWHSTEPELRALVAGPVERLGYSESPRYTQPRADGVSFPGMPARGVKPAEAAATTPEDAPAVPAPKPRAKQHPAAVRGSQALAEVSRRLGGIAPSLLADLSDKTTRERVSKIGKKTTYVVWDNPAIPGVGPLFRSGGESDLSEIARVLEEAGYLTAGTVDADGVAASQRAQEIIRAELKQGGSTLRVGDASAIDTEMRARAQAAMDADANPWDDFSFTPDDLDDSGYSSASTDVRLAVEQLIAEAEAIGIDTETIRDDVARKLGDTAKQEDYDAATQQAITEAIGEARRQPGGTVAGTEGAGGQDRGQTAEQARRPRSGQEPGQSDEGLILTAQTEAGLRERADQEDAAEARQRAAKAAEQARLKKAAEAREIKARTDESVGNFELGQGAEQQMSSMGDMFSGQVAPADDVLDDELRDAMGKLGDVLGDVFGAKLNITGTQHTAGDLLPALSKVVELLVRKGFKSFRGATGKAAQIMRADPRTAPHVDSISARQWRAAYQAIAEMHPGTDSEDAVNAMTADDVKAIVAPAPTETPKEQSRAPSTNTRVEPDRGDTDAAASADGRTVRGEGGRIPGQGRRDGEADRPADQRPEGDAGLHADGAPVVRDGGDLAVRGTAADASPAGGTAGVDDDQRGGGFGDAGVPVEPVPAAGIAQPAGERVQEVGDRAATQAAADKKPVKLADASSIADTLPLLLDGQREDVLKAERRFAKPDGYGMLFTNSPGTGKTWSGLGIVKRFSRQGKTNTIIVAPTDKVIEDWIKSGAELGLTITQLPDVRSAGKGIVITTYANFGQNDALAQREWDLVVHDESHYLMQDADGNGTKALDTLRSISRHPRGAYGRFRMLHAAELAEQARLSTQIADNTKDISATDATDMRRAGLQAQNENLKKLLAALTKKLDDARQAVKADVDAKQGAARTRVVFLSATPFAYEKTIDYAEGYLFDYENADGARYNSGNGREQFFMRHFGYRMRYNKLTAPDAKVDSGLMQRQFNSWLKSQGVLSGRMLDVEPDYDRRFILVDSAIGARIDEALSWLSEASRTAKPGAPNGFSLLSSVLNESFDYLSRRYLLEAIKANEVLPHVREHLEMGRKVVVFHDYKKGGGFNPFRLGGVADTGADGKAFNEALKQFQDEFKDLIDHPFETMPSPIDLFKRELPGVLLFNGDVKPADRRKAVATFQSDDNGPAVILVQSAAGKEGISLHDTTGKYQRVMLNLGQPTQPTTAIQQEGRIYRTGQKTDAIVRYLNTGTNWERWAFATTIAQRASAAENLGMGESARALKDSFIAAFEESSADNRAGMEGEGKGGKEIDKAANNALTQFDRARSFYFGTQKKDSRTKAKEGKDYFATPEPIGLKMVEWLGLRGGEKFLEPSGGHGAIARWAPDNTENSVVEPSLVLRSRLAMSFSGTIIASDFESLHIANKFDGVAMNPPFGTAGRTAIDHLAKAAGHLRDGGRVVAIIPTGPAADKKFDAWFYEETQRDVKPLFEHPTLGPLYRGDVLTTNASWAKSGRLVRRDVMGSLWFKVDGATGESTVDSRALVAVTSKGPRTESFNPADGLVLTADIKLPAVTFERAGTAVATRIVIIDKVAKGQPAPRQIARDLSDIDDINKLFDRIENMEVPERTKPAEPDAQDAVPAIRQSDKTEAAARVESAGVKLIEYKTQKGKIIKGVIRSDLTASQAKAIDPYTWRKDGGYFIRAEHLARLEKAHPSSASAPAASRFSLGAQQQASERVQADAEAIRATWANAPEVVVAFDMADPLVPKEARDAYRKLKASGAQGSPEGFFLGGKVYLMAGNLATPADTARVMAHEALGHAGLSGVFGEQLGAMLDRLAKALPEKVGAKAAQYGLNMSKPADRRHAAEEYLAELAQTRPSSTWVQKAIALIKAWAREHVPGLGAMKMSDSEVIATMIEPARGFVERGRGKADGAVRLSLSPQLPATFDPANPDIRFSLADTTRAIVAGKMPGSQLFNDMAVNTPVDGRLHWWHKTVGPMSHLASKSAPFKRVYDGIQSFIQDASKYATESADLAPDILLKLDHLGDIIPFKIKAFGREFGKSPMRAEDAKVLAASVFHGTLLWTRDKGGKPIKLTDAEDLAETLDTEQKARIMMRDGKVMPDIVRRMQENPLDIYDGWVRNQFEQAYLRAGIVFTPAELKDIFGATPAQVELYRQFRAGVDRSLTSLSVSDMIRLGGADVAGLIDKAMRLNNPTEAADMLADHLRKLADQDPVRVAALAKAEDLNKQARKLNEQADKLEGRIPHMGGVEEEIDDARAELASLRKRASALTAEAQRERIGSGRYQSLNETANIIIDKSEKVADLMARGYAPLMRFGTHKVDVVDADGQRVYFGLFETPREAAQMARRLGAEFPGATITRGTLSQKEHELYAGVTPETLELFGEMLGLDAQGAAAGDEVFQAYLKNAKNQRSAMKRLIHRKGIAGFSEDAGRVLAGFVYSNGRQTAGNLHAGDISTAVRDIPREQGELKDMAIGLQKYVFNPQEEAQAVRSLLFTQYLGGSIAAALVNLTQTPALTFPYLSQWGVAAAAKEIGLATRDMGRKSTGDAALDAALKNAEEEGIVAPQEVHQLMAQARGAATLRSGDGTLAGNARARSANLLSRVNLAWGKPFSWAEMANRRIAFIAAYRTAVREGLGDPAKFAEQAVSDTQFTSNKGNKPRWARGAIGATLFTFKSYSVNYLSLMNRLWTQGEPGSQERKNSRRSVALSMLMLWIMAGADGLPGEGDAEDLIDGILQRLGYNFSSKEAKRTFLMETLGFSDAAHRFITKGISGLPGSPIDVSGRLGMSNLIPGTGALTKKTDYTDDVFEIGGAFGGLVKSGFNAAGHLVEGIGGSIRSGDPMEAATSARRAAEEVAPVAAKNLVKAAQMANTGQYKDSRGNKVEDVGMTDAIAKGIGFQPNVVARTQEDNRRRDILKGLNKQMTNDIIDRWAQGIADNDAPKVARAEKMLAIWNRANPESQITPDSIRAGVKRKVGNMRLDRDQRGLRSTPKGMRAAVAQELQAAD